MSQEHQQEISGGQRFQFGKNWSRFLTTLNDNKIKIARQSLMAMLGIKNLAGRSFLDIGSGSGLFSLAAYELGANVRSFDYDPNSTACTAYLHRRYCTEPNRWHVGEGSVLDKMFLSSLGKFDIVYSWGVLHHTGKMWEALDNAAVMVADGGFLFIALYNDEGPRSRIWLWIKKIFNKLPIWLRIPYGVLVATVWELRALLAAVVRLRPLDYLRSWTRYQETSLRGMSKWHDIVDWIGGYPFEVASPGAVVEFLLQRGFVVTRLRTTRGLGCNEFVFRKFGVDVRTCESLSSPAT